MCAASSTGTCRSCGLTPLCALLHARRHLQELLQDQDVTRTRTKRYRRMMEEAMRYQKVKKRKTDMPRNSKKPARPKH